MIRLKKQLANARGYTLIEMLLVLFIVTIMSTIILKFSHEKLTHYTFMKTVDQIELLLRATQAQVIDERVNMGFQVTYGQYINVHKGLLSEVMYQMKLPEGMTVLITTGNNRIDFMTDGNVKNIGKIIFFMEDMHIRYSINIGKGRFLIVE